MYAASAYIGREPTLLGTLKGQDIFKMACLGVIVVGVLFMTLGVLFRGKPYDFLLQLITVRSGS